MRVGDRDRGNAAQRLYPGHRIAIDEADAVPQNVAGAILNHESTLSNGELRVCPDAPNSRALWIERVMMCGSQIVQRNPMLSLQADILALIVANRAAFRRALDGRKLRPAGYANIRWQRLAPANRFRQ